MNEQMRSATMIDDALGVFKSEEYSRFQNFDDALDALTCRLYEREYYNTPNSSIRIRYNLEIHRFQTIASSSLSSFQYSDAYTRTDDENNKARYPSTTLTIVEIKTNQNEFDDYIENIIDKHTYTLEDLTKDEYRKLIIEPALIGRSRVSSQLFRHGPIERNLGLGVTDGTSESRPHSGKLSPNMG